MTYVETEGTAVGAVYGPLAEAFPVGEAYDFDQVIWSVGPESFALSLAVMLVCLCTGIRLWPLRKAALRGTLLWCVGVLGIDAWAAMYNQPRISDVALVYGLAVGVPFYAGLAIVQEGALLFGDKVSAWAEKARAHYVAKKGDQL